MEKYKLHRRLVTIKCDYCGCKCEKPISEVNRNKKLNKHLFCSRSCSGKYVNSLKLPPTEKQLQSQQNIRKYSGNHRDKYSGLRELLRRAKRRDNNCNLTLDYMLEVWNNQNGICPYSKLKLILPKTNNKDIPIPHLASLDRIDSQKGYIIGNIQFVSVPINYMKSTMSDLQTKEFINEMISAIFIAGQTISSSSNEEQGAQAGN